MSAPATCAAQPRQVVNALTVDVEDYFHVTSLAAVAPRDSWDGFAPRVTSNVERLLALFERAGTRATFFVLGWVASRHPELVRLVAQQGHEIASHGYGHELVYEMSPARFREDVRRSRGLLEGLSGQPVLGYRAPSFSITSRSLWALDVLVEEGYCYDASIFPVVHDRYGIPGFERHAHVIPTPAGPLMEAPASTARVAGMTLPVAGGGYFRLLPYAWTRWGIRVLNRRERRPAVFYIHPWEIDPGQPRLQAAWPNRVRHYRGLERTEAKLARLLSEFRFGPVREVFSGLLPGAA